MSRHLPLLQSMFPGKLMLNVDDVASLMSYSKGHIYNLASAKKLPFKIADGLGDRLLVSIIEMADYLDSKLLTQAPEKVAPEQEAATPTKRKVGRPRGTTKAALQVRCFQAELRTAIYRQGFNGILEGLRLGSSGIDFPDDDRACLERMKEVQQSLLDQVGKAEAGFQAIEFEFLSRDSSYER